MKRATLLATVALLPLSLACSGGGGGPAATPTASVGGTATPVASGTKGPATGGAPSVRDVQFRPPQSNGYPTATDTITAFANTVDTDGDGVSVTWRWFINGAEVPGELADTLRPAPGRWKKGDKIEAEATPRDTKNNIGSPGRGFILIRNSTPALTSRPTGSLNGYKPVLQDADEGTPNEHFTWSLEAPVPGFSIAADGTLRFDAATGQAANGKQVTIMVTDSAGAIAKQTFDVKF